MKINEKLLIFLQKKQKNYDIITSVRFLVHIGNVFD